MRKCMKVLIIAAVLCSTTCQECNVQSYQPTHPGYRSVNETSTVNTNHLVHLIWIWQNINNTKLCCNCNSLQIELIFVIIINWIFFAIFFNKMRVSQKCLRNERLFNPAYSSYWATMNFKAPIINVQHQKCPKTFARTWNKYSFQNGFRSFHSAYFSFSSLYLLFLYLSRLRAAGR